MSYYDKNCQMQSLNLLTFLGICAEYGFSTFFHCTCNECADTLTCVFGGSGDDVVGSIVQVSCNPMRKSLPWPAPFAAVACLRHGPIVRASPCGTRYWLVRRC